MEVESSVSLLTRLSRSDGLSWLPPRGCSRSLSLPAVALRPPESFHPSDIPASRRTRRLLRKQFAASIETPHETGPFARPGSWTAPSSRPREADEQLPALPPCAEAGGRISAHRARSVGFVLSSPTAAQRRSRQRECHNRSVCVPSRALGTLHVLPYFPLSTLHFLLSTGGCYAPICVGVRCSRCSFVGGLRRRSQAVGSASCAHPCRRHPWGARRSGHLPRARP